MAPRLGRPPSSDPRKRTVAIRLTEEEFALLAEAASYTDEPLAVYIRRHILRTARRTVKG